MTERETGRQRDAGTREIGMQASEIGEKATLGEKGRGKTELERDRERQAQRDRHRDKRDMLNQRNMKKQP